MRKPGVFSATAILLCILSFPSFILAQEMPSAPGRIAYIGADFNVYTVRPGSTPTALSDDAALTQDQAILYEWPMWSTDGQLAYIHSTLQRTGAVTTRVLISPDGETPGEVAYVGEQEYFTYASWSPQACGENCDHLALLLNNASGLLVKLVRWEGGEGTSSVAGTGAPFYSSWSPDGTQMVWQRNNAQFEIFDVGEGAITQTLEELPGRMFTPEWSPVDDRLLLGIRRETSTDLVIWEDGELTTLATDLQNPLWFAWSPDGSSVAYINRQDPLVVLDAATGDEIARSPVDGVLAFFWAPDSQQIAYISLGSPAGSFSAYAPADEKALAMKQPQQPSGIAWSVLDTASGANRRYSSFQPTNQQLYLFQYFDQFASSHHLWSPDSRYLVYSEIAPDARPVIRVLDTTQDVAIPSEIGEGLVGVWSFS